MSKNFFGLFFCAGLVLANVASAHIEDSDHLTNIVAGSRITISIPQGINIKPDVTQIYFYNGKPGWDSAASANGYCTMQVVKAPYDRTLRTSAPKSFVLTSRAEQQSIPLSSPLVERISCYGASVGNDLGRYESTIGDLRRHFGTYVTLTLPSTVIVEP